MKKNETVAVARCPRYDVDEILRALECYAEGIGLNEEAVRGKRIVLKPNLLLAYTPDKAATTHPAVVEGAILLLKKWGAGSILLAESPGGIYSEKSLRHVYRVTGMEEVAVRNGVPLNYDVSYTEVSVPDGVATKTVDTITPIVEADVIVNLCKIKTHALAVMTCASKNLFGVIPGIRKFEMHARFKKPSDFFSMVIDVDCALDRAHTVFHIADGIVGMEGDGPSGGDPRALGVLLMSRNPFCLDLVAAEIIGVSGRVPLLTQAAERGLCPDTYTEVTTIGLTPAEVGAKPFVLPDAAMGRRFDLIPGFLQPRPIIDRAKCRGCKLCIESCPQKTIVLHKGKARILPDNCIKCYCCQELCTFKAVKIKKSVIYKLVERL